MRQATGKGISLWPFHYLKTGNHSVQGVCLNGSIFMIRFEGGGEAQPLVYIDVADGRTDQKNTAPAEVEEIIRRKILMQGGISI